MPQVFSQLEKIGSISHSGGMIILAPSVLTMGGQQYTTGTLSVANGIISPNLLHFVYANLINGVVALNVSYAVPSVYKQTAPLAVLVGAFYSSGATGFGSFCTIEGVPTTQQFDAGPLFWSASSGALTKGSVSVDVSLVKRVGDQFLWQWSYRHSTGGTGTGNLYLNVPTNLSFENSRWPTTTEIVGTRAGGYITTSADGRSVNCFSPGGGTVIGFNYSNNAANAVVSMSSHPYSNSGFQSAGECWLPVAGLTNTPLKDL